MKTNVLLLLMLLSANQLFARVSLPGIFGDNMVLQRNRTIPVWGWADAGEKISVQLDQQTKSAVADKNGNWRVDLSQETAGGPFRLTIKGTNTISFNNVMVGEVWICSGQSNMEMPVEGWGKVDHYEQEISEANYPEIRHIKIPNSISTVPQKDIPNTEWKVCSPANAGDFSAVGYFFARELYRELHISIGLINTSWGGTHVETWTSREAFEGSDEFKGMIAGMPRLDLDSLSKVRSDAAIKKIEAIQGTLPRAGETSTWKNPGLDDSKWPVMQLPSLWEQKQPGDLDGVVWFRKTFDAAPIEEGKEATLDLAMIDDHDSTFVNGLQVGVTNSYNAHRRYSIPAGIIKAGKNVIAVRVEDTGGGGGIYGEPSEMKLTLDDRVIPLSGDWLFKIDQIYGGANAVGPNSYPTLLFNAMVNPLIPFAMAGVIWYQGESNAGRAYQYRKAFPLLINDWRKRWAEGNFPFYFVQLASFNAANGNSRQGSTWAELREAQTMTLSLPNTGMAVTTDIGNSTDIHPKDKQDVGKRLAAIALHDVYKKDMVFSGPMYKSMRIDGNKAVVYFTHTGKGLSAVNGQLRGFEVAGPDKQFYEAAATIEGDHIIVFSEKVSNPVAVRFGWMDDASEDNLFNKEGFPASPFRTDNWKGITEENKFTIGQ